MKNFWSRFLTAAVAVPIILGLLYLLPWYAFGILAFAALVVSAFELFAITHPDDVVGRVAGVLLTAGIFSVLVWTQFATRHPTLTLAAVLCVTPVALLVTLFRAGDQKTALLRMSALSMGPLYLGASIGAIACLRRVDEAHGARVGAGLVVLTLMIAWFSDTAGYIVGKSVKGPRLYEAVSPNKTWSGAIGGLAGSALGALLAHFVYLPQLPLARGLAVAVVCGAVGQAGDLCESLMKRSGGVKDSGAILPGHGGMLDRLDAMMFVAIGLYAAVRSGWLPL
ncbi:MAG: phosphatidate cytidylyltransferase [Deltaproteobacteria bacterium]